MPCQFPASTADTALYRALRHSENLFFGLRVDGHFDYVHTRAMCRAAEGVPLVKAAAVQPEFEFRDVVGTLVGFWTPQYAKTLNVPGVLLYGRAADRAGAVRDGALPLSRLGSRLARDAVRR